MSSEFCPVDGLHAYGSRRQRVGASSITQHHRIGEVLKEEGVSMRCAADRMGINTSQATREADPTCDLNLSALYRWQAALQVPIADLLTPPSSSLAPVIELRASLLKAMRTVRSLQLHVDDERGQVLSISLATQLVEIMPELRKISCWPVCGTRRGPDELGAIVDRQVPDEFFDATERP